MAVERWHGQHKCGKSRASAASRVLELLARIRTSSSGSSNDGRRSLCTRRIMSGERPTSWPARPALYKTRSRSHQPLTQIRNQLDGVAVGAASGEIKQNKIANFVRNPVRTQHHHCTRPRLQFLHTLRFKKLLPPRVTFSVYTLMAYASFAGGAALLPLFVEHPKIIAFTAVGMLLNFWRGRQYLLKIYFVVALLLFTATRFAIQAQAASSASALHPHWGQPAVDWLIDAKKL